MAWNQPSTDLLALSTGFIPTAALNIILKLHVPEAMSAREGPWDVAELATAVGADADALGRVLAVLAQEEVFAKDDKGQYSLTRVSTSLVGPDSLAPMVEFLGSPFMTQTLSRTLLDTVKAGRSDLQFFDVLKSDPSHAASFDAAMASMAVATVPPLLATCDFSSTKTLCEVGGNRGAVVQRILDAGLTGILQGIVFDLPEVVSRAVPGEKLSFVGGDMFDAASLEAVRGADTYMVKHCAHNWDDDRCVALFSNIAKLLAPNGRLLLVESMLDAPAAQPIVGRMDLLMCSLLNARERTSAHYVELLKRAGLEVTAVCLDTGSPLVSVIEAAAEAVGGPETVSGPAESQ